jgi:hypothetical protein
MPMIKNDPLDGNMIPSGDIYTNKTPLKVVGDSIDQEVDFTAEDVAILFEDSNVPIAIKRFKVYGTDEGNTATRVDDASASGGKALYIPEGKQARWSKRIPYDTEDTYIIQIRAKQITAGNLIAGVIGYDGETPINRNGLPLIKDFVECVISDSDNPIDSAYKTYSGFISGTGSTYVEPAHSTGVPSAIPTGSKSFSVMVKAESGSFYIDSISYKKVVDVDSLTQSVTIVPSSNVIEYSYRDGYVSNVGIFAVLRNIPDTVIPIWSCDQATLVPVSGDPLSIGVDSSTINNNVIVVEVSVNHQGKTFTDIVTLGTSYIYEEPSYFGLRSAVPVETDGGQSLIDGDWFLWSGTSTSEFTFGHIYMYSGSEWFETEDSQKVAAVVYDGIQLAKDTGEVVYATTIYAELINAQDIVVTKTISSDAYEEEGGVPISGFKLDGPNNVIKSFGSVFRDCDVYGTFTSDEFSTQAGILDDTISAQSPSDTLWSEEDFYDNFPISETREFQPITGTLGSHTLDGAIKTKNNYALFDEQTAPNVSVGPGSSEEHPKVLLEYTVPDTYGSGKLRLRFKSKLGGILTYMKLLIYRGGSLITRWRKGSEYFTYESAGILAGDVIKIVGWNGFVIFRYTMSLEYFYIESVSSYSGVVVKDSAYNLFLLCGARANTYHEDVRAITSPVFSSNSIVSKKSGSGVVSAYGDIPSSYTSCSGTVTVDGVVSLGIDKVKRVGNVITFCGGVTEVSITNFVDGTSTGAYTALSLGAVTLLSQSPAVRVMNVVPKDDSYYDVGQLGDGIVVESWKALTVEASLGDRVRGSDGRIYACILSSGSISTDAEPVVGDDWQTYWVLDDDQSGTKIQFRNGYFSGDVNVGGGGTLPTTVDTENLGSTRTFYTDIDITATAPVGSDWTTSADARAWLRSTSWGVDDWNDTETTQPE